MNKLVTIVIPCYNSEKTIGEVVKLCEQEFKTFSGYEVEIVLVNDCSSDSTWNEIEKSCRTYKNVKGINLAINTGQHNAIMAGFHYASGDYILCMDDDLQTHPSQIKKILDKIEEGYDLVFATYPQEKQNLFRRLGSWFNALTVNFLLKTDKNIKVTSFFVFRKFILKTILQYKNSYTHLRGLLMTATQNIGTVEVLHFDRKEGASTYTLKKLIRLWSSCINFSIIPLRFASVFGGLTALIGFFFAVYIVIHKIINPNVAVGWTSTISITLLFSGIILVCLGIIGEYIGRIFLAINRTPQYVVRDEVGVQEKES